MFVYHRPVFFSPLQLYECPVICNSHIYLCGMTAGEANQICDWLLCSFAMSLIWRNRHSHPHTGQGYLQTEGIWSKRKPVLLVLVHRTVWKQPVKFSNWRLEAPLKPQPHSHNAHVQSNTECNPEATNFHRGADLHNIFIMYSGTCSLSSFKHTMPSEWTEVKGHDLLLDSKNESVKQSLFKTHTHTSTQISSSQRMCNFLTPGKILAVDSDDFTKLNVTTILGS